MSERAGHTALERAAHTAYALARIGPVALLVPAAWTALSHPWQEPTTPWHIAFWAVAGLSLLGTVIGAVAWIGLGRVGSRGVARRKAAAATVVGLAASAIVPGSFRTIAWLPDEVSRWPRISTCLSNTKQIGLGLGMYRDDYDQYMPPGEQWNDAVITYARSPMLLLCPSSEERQVPSYAINGRLVGIRTDRVRAPESTVVLFDSVPGRNMHGGPELLPRPPRHRQNEAGEPCAAVGFADGHARMSGQRELTKLAWVQKLGPSR
jgi:hypothetical protein